MSVVSSLDSDNCWKLLGAFRWFQVVPRFSKYIDALIKKCRLAGAYPRNSVGRGGLEKCHKCYTNIVGLKGTLYTKYLLIAPYTFELH